VQSVAGLDEPRKSEALPKALPRKANSKVKSSRRKASRRS